MTKKQKELFDYIVEFLRMHGYAPSYREMMQALGYKSVSTVAKHVDNLVIGGHLCRRDGAARSLELPSPEADEPWWRELERAIATRESSTDEHRAAEAIVLRQALEIVRK